MQRIGAIGVVTVVAGVLSLSANAEETCRDQNPGAGRAEGQLEKGDRLYLSNDQCEAAAKRELRLSLFEISQEEEDPMSVSVGLKLGGGILRFRIPFSF